MAFKILNKEKVISMQKVYRHFLLIILNIILAILMTGVALGTDESEPNNDFSGANTIDNIDSITGKFDLNDTDVYKISLTSDGRLDLNLTQPKGIEGNIQVFDESQDIKMVLESTKAGAPIKGSGILKAGDYYIVIEEDNGKSSDLDYNLDVNFIVTKTENEPNNQRDSANEIQINDSITGLIDVDYDQDVYLFNVNEPGMVNIKVTPPEGLELIIKVVYKDYDDYDSDYDNENDGYYDDGYYYDGNYYDNGINYDNGNGYDNGITYDDEYDSDERVVFEKYGKLSEVIEDTRFYNTGDYYVYISESNGNTSEDPYSLDIEYNADTTPPEITNVKLNSTVFNPNGKNIFKVNYNLSEDASVEAYIEDLKGNEIKVITSDGYQGGNELTWDGKNDNGKFVLNGKYVVKLIAKDASDNTSEQVIKEFEIRKVIPLNKKGTVKVNRVKMFAGPGTANKLITTLSKDTKLTVLEAAGDWYKVKLTNGKTGYINKNYISLGR